MSYTVLARKYRSGNFDQLVGQDHVARTLKKALQTGRLAHAFLFCGTRGTGKTSSARILAKAFNCSKFDAPTPDPCGVCESCMAIARGDDIDVIEIDAASNTGVDNVREIIENAQYRPARSRFKVYIIDEVHMLSKSAFNALLKTLEEPPAHVKFILATTEPEKVPPTILSRCQRYDFRNIPSKEIAAHLQEICKKEGIDADPTALALVARAGAGSMRDALSLLDRLLSIGERTLSVQSIEEMLGLPRAQKLSELVESIGSGDVSQTLKRADDLITSGLSPDSLLAGLSDHLRNLLIAATCGADSGLLDVPGIPDQELLAQARKFKPVFLAQDIAIIEELRRTMRQNQTGRAMLDATLVRLTLAEQFAPIGPLLAESSPSGEKKKPEPATVNPPTINRPVIAVAPAARAISVPPVSAPLVVAPEKSQAEEKSPADSSPNDQREEDDDLPRPGKVWEGPSLKELLATNGAGKAAAAPLGNPDLQTLWKNLLETLSKNGAGFNSAMALARLETIDEGQAIIRFSHHGETFARTYSTNGKREQIARALSELRGQPTGVKFEVDAEPAPNQEAAAPRRADPAPAAEAPQAAPIAQVQRASPREIAEAESDPLVQTILREFGGSVRNVE